MKTYRFEGGIPTEEKETIIRYDYLEKKWYLDSSVSTHINKAIEQGWEMVRETVNEDGHRVEACFVCSNPKAITIRSAEKIVRNITEEQKQAMADRMRNCRKDSLKDD